MGMTGRILQLDESRVVKVARVFSPDDYSGRARQNMDYSNSINRDTLKREKAIYQRLGNYKGIIHCFNASEDGIELAFAKQGDLETYIERNIEPQEPFKTKWILSLTDTLSYVHSRKVFVDEIALRNILVADGQLKLADFGQSVLLPMEANVDTICEEDLTARIEIFHLGWIIYSIAGWRVYKYYFYGVDPRNGQVNKTFLRQSIFSVELSLRNVGMENMLA
jgi:serine/threonine protein kinase